MQLRASVTLDEQRDEVSDSAVDVPGMDLGDEGLDVLGRDSGELTTQVVEHTDDGLVLGGTVHRSSLSPRGCGDRKSVV